jgi:hypothetical protein
MMKSMGEKDLILSLRAQGAGVAEARDLAYVAGALAVVPDPEIDAAFANELEATLMAEFDAQMAPNVTQLRPAQPMRRIEQPAAAVAAPKTTKTSSAPIATVIPLPRRKLVIRKAMAAAIAAALMLALPVAASANALPSSPMYKGKLALEDIRGFFTSGAAKGFFYLQRAKTRSEELAQETALGHTAVLAKVARLMQSEQAEGTKLILGSNPTAAELAQAAGTLREISQQLSSLLNVVPAAVRPTVLGALNKANALATSLDGTANGTLLPKMAIPVPAAPGDPTAAVQPASPSSGSTASTGSTAGTGAGGGSTGGAQAPTGGGTRTGDITAPDTCQVPGSADGLTDVTAPLAKVMC